MEKNSIRFVMAKNDYSIKLMDLMVGEVPGDIISEMQEMHNECSWGKDLVATCKYDKNLLMQKESILPKWLISAQLKALKKVALVFSHFKLVNSLKFKRRFFEKSEYTAKNDEKDNIKEIVFTILTKHGRVGFNLIYGCICGAMEGYTIKQIWFSDFDYLN